ncbi:hypothetical protein D3C71_1705130 [compost metagenome]
MPVPRVKPVLRATRRLALSCWLKRWEIDTEVVSCQPPRVCQRGSPPSADSTRCRCSAQLREWFATTVPAR